MRETMTAVNQPPRGNVTTGMDRILSMPRASVYRAAALSLGTGAGGNSIAWDTSDYDTDGMWDGVGSFTARTAGVYAFEAWVGFVNDATGYRVVYFRKNGAGVIRPASDSNPGAASYLYLGTSALIYLNAGDAIDVVAVQTTAGALGMDPASATNRVNGFQACLVSL